MASIRNRQLRASLIGVAAILLLVGVYLGVMRLLHRAPVLNAEVVEAGKLIRSGQPEPGDLDRIKAADGLGTILCLRGKEDPEIIAWAKANRVPVIVLQMWADLPPDPAQVGIFFDIMRGDTLHLDRYRDLILETEGVQGPATRLPFPVLIHCEGGADRTGVMVALYRMAFQGWPLDQAKQEMTLHFHISFSHPKLFEFLQTVAPQLNQKYGHREAPNPAPSRP